MKGVKKILCVVDPSKSRQRLFVGATAEETLQKLSCDVLAIKPDGFKTPVDENTE